MVKQKKPEWQKYSPIDFIQEFGSLHDSIITGFKLTKKECLFSLRWYEDKGGLFSIGVVNNFPFAELKIKGFNKVHPKSLPLNRGEEFYNMIPLNDRVIIEIARYCPPAENKTITIFGKNLRFSFRQWFPGKPLKKMSPAKIHYPAPIEPKLSKKELEKWEKKFLSKKDKKQEAFQLPFYWEGLPFIKKIKKAKKRAVKK